MDAEEFQARFFRTMVRGLMDHGWNREDAEYMALGFAEQAEPDGDLTPEECAEVELELMSDDGE